MECRSVSVYKGTFSFFLQFMFQTVLVLLIPLSEINLLELIIYLLNCLNHV